MGTAGGIIGLIGGIFAVFAALFTLFMGGIGSAFEAHGAKAIVDFGWYGLASAFLVIVFGAVTIGKSNVGAFGLLLMSAIGVAVGGTAVAICLALSFLGGLLAASTKDAKADKRTWWQWLGLPLGVAAAVVISLQVSKVDEVRALAVPAAAAQPIITAAPVVAAAPAVIPPPVTPQAASMAAVAASAPSTPTNPDLSRYVGQHPFFILKDASIKDRLALFLLGEYPQFEERFEVTSNLQEVNGFYFGSGCARHQCSMEESAFAINKETGAIVAAILTDGKDIRLFGASEVANLPPPLLSWYRSVGGKE